jgi:tRNA threonylcarbamoyladenosine biosynthesis protein TsaB
MLLAIDSATRLISIALHDGSAVHAELTWRTQNQHTVSLMPALQDLLARAEVELSALTGVAVSQGPGSFNGLRIGFSVAKGLALALRIPLLAIPTLDAVALAQPGGDAFFAPEAAERAVLLAFLQVGRGRVCVQTYRREASRWRPNGDLRITPLASALAESSAPLIVAGEMNSEGQLAVEAAIIKGKQVAVSPPALALRRAAFVAELAWQRWRSRSVGEALDEALTAAPFYLHQPGVPHP